MIRSRMIKILLDREFRRLRKNPSALMLIGLLSAVALLMATSRPLGSDAGSSSGAGSARPATPSGSSTNSAPAGSIISREIYRTHPLSASCIVTEYLSKTVA